MTDNPRLPLPTDRKPGDRVRGTHRANVRQWIMEEARMIMGVSAGLINLYGSMSFSYYYSPTIPLMLLTLERRMLGLISEVVALQVQEKVDQCTGK
ncbi:hypothetical protein N7501_004137 [Penicillium viridicatum]|nr:hypothetical protein N7501_004137 [Penicillium viridicatum]